MLSDNVHEESYFRALSSVFSPHKRTSFMKRITFLKQIYINILIQTKKKRVLAEKIFRSERKNVVNDE